MASGLDQEADVIKCQWWLEYYANKLLQHFMDMSYFYQTALCASPRGFPCVAATPMKTFKREVQGNVSVNPVK